MGMELTTRPTGLGLMGMELTTRPTGLGLMGMELTTRPTGLGLMGMELTTRPTGLGLIGIVDAWLAVNANAAQKTTVQTLSEFKDIYIHSPDEMDYAPKD